MATPFDAAQLTVLRRLAAAPDRPRAQRVGARAAGLALVVATAALERRIALGYAGRGDTPEATGVPDAPLAYRITAAGLARLAA
jgi:hypothetical protein